MARKKKIIIQTFNPYEARYPGRKVISRDTLNAVKQLRNQNIDVVILPEDGRPVEYVFRKGMLDFLRDPIIAFFVGVPVNVACGLMTSAVQYAWGRFQNVVLPGRPPETPNILFKVEGENRTFSCSGQPMDGKSVARIVELVQQGQRDYAAAMTEKRPYPNRSAPLFREHVPHVVGWCAIGMEDGELIARDAVITDPITLEMLKSGELRGMSVAGIATKSICSICSGDYVACNHVAGEMYDGNECLNGIEESILVDVSLVRDPVNVDCFLRIVESAGVA